VFTIAELVLVYVLSSRVQSMSVGGARATFFAYALLNGMVLSYYFLVFNLSTLVLAFLATSLYFGLMAVYGTTTHRDLSGWGPKLMMGLFALIITGFVGMLFGMSFLTTVLYSAVGLVVFMLLTAYDTQKLSQMFSYYAYDGELAEKASIYGTDPVSGLHQHLPVCCASAGHEQPPPQLIFDLQGLSRKGRAFFVW